MITLNQQGEQLIVSFQKTNKLNILNSSVVKETLLNKAFVKSNNLVFDFSDIRFIDSSGFNLLVELNNQQNQNGKKLYVSGVSDEAKELLELMKLNFPVYNSEIAA
ncbi:MAG: STAS domain-containing protein [Bacteroidales bacterium]|nr:STAS domain-containing protein [Bacteroidales bacterium]